MKTYYSNSILSGLVLCLLALGIGCANYVNVDAVESINRLERIYACKFPLSKEIAIAQLRFGDTTSYIGKFQCGSNELKIFLASFSPTIVLYTNKFPWGVEKESPTGGVKWWDAHEMKECSSGVLESSTLEFFISASMVETNTHQIHFKASFESGVNDK